MNSTILRASLAAIYVSVSLVSAAESKLLKDALLLHASFDNQLDADFAVGDKTFYATDDKKNRATAKPGLPANGLVKHAKGEGRHGDALHFTKKMAPIVFFKGEKNLAYNTNNWSGSASFWMRLNPDQDLEPGYCDPLQYVAQAWGEGNMFVEFSKDHTPRHFRYAIMCVTKIWNPDNRKWEEIPDKERPMVPVYQPPFSREKWTHVAFSFENINTGKKNGIGKLYLNGEFMGEFTGREQTFNWDVSQSAITMGLNYTGHFDDLAIFNRPLKPAEVKEIYNLKNGIRDLRK